ncbi:hypothetical protein Dsin_005126 [Dipteronia sinensis]|uniref:MULE transposase domain-containing protein n=1 Tax=Dipteronia sinensis TaxID=43782 RepID=A0AAE0EEL9_9ROSI|nr:hypothetical protein Dsin_005126 [Dipteronia sinensis]
MPACAHMLPSQRTLSSSQAIEVDLAEEFGIPLKSLYELLGRQVGGRESLGYVKGDQKNYLRSKRQKKLAYGEAGCLLKYVSNQTLKNPSIFYVVQLDNEEHITNIFWEDAEMIMDYGHFGNVVSFDTTYKTNKENRPFGVFVGLNHHRETVIFVASLIILSGASEKEKTYNLANAYESNLAKLVEDILRLEMDYKIHEKEVEYQDVDVEVEYNQDYNLVKAKGLKKKGTSRGQRRFRVPNVQLQGYNMSNPNLVPWNPLEQT